MLGQEVLTCDWGQYRDLVYIQVCLEINTGMVARLAPSLAQSFRPDPRYT